MYIIIAMAGESRRFVEHGINDPKFKLIIKDKPLFDWALTSLYCYYDKAEFVFVARGGFNEFISKRCKILGINSYMIITLDTQTDGQATTVIKGTQSLEETEPILIYNIDTHIKPDVLQVDDIKPIYDGWLLLFTAPGTHWSFAKLNEDGCVIEISEKNRISEYASTGLYYFRTLSLFKTAYFSLVDEIKEKYKETYIAPLYNALIKNKNNIGSKIIDFEDVIPLGTPAEVAIFDPDFLKKYNNSRTS